MGTKNITTATCGCQIIIEYGKGVVYDKKNCTKGHK